MSLCYEQVTPWSRAADALTNDVLAIDAQLASIGSASIRSPDGVAQGFALSATVAPRVVDAMVVHLCSNGPVPVVDRDVRLIVRFHGLSDDPNARALLQRSELVLATAPRTADVALRAGARDVVVMPPFVPLDELVRSTATPTGTIVTIGPFRRLRRAERAVLCDHLLRSHVDPESVVSMIGHVPDPTVATGIGGISDALRLGNPLAGVLPHPVYVNAVAGATSMLLFGDEDTFGIAAVEAMAAGVPVVAVGGTTLAETVGDSAVVLSANDEVAVIAEALHAIRTDGAYRRSLVARGRRRAEELAPARSASILHSALSRCGLG